MPRVFRAVVAPAVAFLFLLPSGAQSASPPALNGAGASAAVPRRQRELTLPIALRAALAHQPLVHAAEGAVEAARGLGEQTSQWASPTLSYTDTRVTHDAAVGELFTFPGKRALRAQAAALSVSQAVEHLRAIQASIAFQVRQAFYRRLLAAEELHTARATLAAVERIRNAAQARFQAGDAARLDVLRADVALERARQAVRAAKGQRKVANLALNLILARPPGTGVAIRGELAALPTVPVLKTLMGEAERQDPALRSARLEEQKRQRDLRLARLQKFPNLDLTASYGIEDGIRTPGVTASIAIPLPGRYHGQVEQAMGNQLAAKAGLEAAYYHLTEAVASADQQWLTAKAQVSAYQSKLLPESATVLAGAQASYRAGETGILSLLAAERTNLAVHQAYAQALYAAQIAAARTILARGGVR